MKTGTPIPAKSLRIGILGLCALLGVNASSGETANIHLKTQAGVPLAGKTVIFYLMSSPFTVIDSQITDATGSCTITDNTYVGQTRCIKVADMPGWTFDPCQYSACAPYPSCSSSYSGDLSFWGKLILDINTSIKVFGGANGYVNPNLNEVATIVVDPPNGGVVTLKIYTLRGKLVVTKTQSITPHLQNSITWDARDTDGKTVASGIYIAHVSGAGLNNPTAKIAVVKN